MKREDILKRPAYWFEHEQNELFRQVTAYMEREGINRTELAKRLNVHKSHISQILNGNFNFTLKKWIELCLAIELIPKIQYENVETVLAADGATTKVVDLYDWAPEQFSAAKIADSESNYSSSNREEITTSLKIQSAPHKLIRAS